MGIGIVVKNENAIIIDLKNSMVFLST